MIQGSYEVRATFANHHVNIFLHVLNISMESSRILLILEGTT